jgi:hypothetical protein
MIGSGNRRSRRSAAVLVLALAVGLGGCHERKTEPKAIVRAPVAATMTRTPRALFLASSVADPALRLHEIDPDAAIRQVEFEDSDGNPVAVTVTVVEALSRDWLWVELSYEGLTAAGDAYPISQKALLRVADGKLFDAEELSPWNAHVKGGKLYAYMSVGWALVGVDLASMLAVPVNNPSYDPVQGPFLVDHQGNVRTEVWRNGSAETKIFFADNSPPVVDPRRAESGFCANSPLATVYGEDGHIYVVCSSNIPDPEGSTTTRYLEYFVREVSFTASGAQVTTGAVLRRATCTGPTDNAIVCPEAQIQATTLYGLDSRSRYLPLTSGFFTMTPVPAGGISLSWTDLALPASISLIAGDHGYWQAGDTVSRIRFQAGASAEPVVAVPNLISWKVAGGVLVFTKYLTGTAIGTYAVPAPGMDPMLISSSDMQVQQIVEL